jgi:hypothetical protein
VWVRALDGRGHVKELQVRDDFTGVCCMETWTTG